MYVEQFCVTVKYLWQLKHHTMKMYGGMELLVCGLLSSTKMEVIHVPSTSTPQIPFHFARIGACWTLALT
jgi:hypothetical protein